MLSRPEVRPSPFTMRDLLRQRLAEAGDGMFGAYERQGRRFSAMPTTELWAEVVKQAVHLRRNGVGGGDLLLLAFSNPASAWTAYLATVCAGGVPAIAPYRPALDGPARSRERLDLAHRALGGRARTYGPTGSGDGGGFDLGPLGPGDDEPAPTEAEVSSLLRSVDPTDTVHIQFSSGSTREPRAIVVTHGSLVANATAWANALGLGPDDTLVSWLPLYHDLGLVGGCVASLLAGADLYLLSPFDFLRDPLCWVESMSALGGTISCAPDFALRQVVRAVRAKPPRGLDLRPWRRLVSGGEPVQTTTLRSFASAMAPFGFDPTGLTPGYGLAEATLYVRTTVGAPWRVVTRGDLMRQDVVEVLDEGPVLGSTAPNEPNQVEWVSVGPPGDIDARICAPGTDLPLGEDRCGEIVVSGPSVTGGYLRPEGGIDRFAPTALRTGDIGFVHAGHLYVVDRIKNVIIRHGENHSAAALEHALARAIDVPPDRVLVVDPDLRSGAGEAVVVLELHHDDDPDDLLERAREAGSTLDLVPSELLLVKPRSLPRTTSGKKQHGLVRRLLASDELRVVARDGRAEPAGSDRCERADERDGDADGGRAEGDQGPGGVVDVDRLDRQHRVLRLVAEAAKAQGIDVEVTVRSHLEADLGIDSLALFELAVVIEGELGVAFADDSLAGLERVADLVAITERAWATPSAGGGLQATADRLLEAAPGTRFVVERQSRRQLFVAERWLADFASCNYLGFDLDEEVRAAIEPMVDHWGTHPSWTRAVASPQPYVELEAGLADLVGVADTVVFPTVTLVHLGLLPRLAGPTGAILLDSEAHHSIQEAAALAGARGTSVVTWRHADLDDLDRALRSQRSRSGRVIAVDGIYSMSGSAVDLPAVVELASAHDATVYVDDAHGIGLLGERPTGAMPYGHGGGGVARHFATPYERLVYVGGLSKAFSSMAAFVTCTGGLTRSTIEAASTLVFSGPVPVASLATALAGLRVNRTRGDVARGLVHRLTRRLVDGLVDAGFDLDGHRGFPIVNVMLGSPDVVLSALDALWHAGVVVTPSVFPAAPLLQGGVRFTPTAANTAEEVDLAVAAMAGVRRRLPASWAAG